VGVVSVDSTTRRLTMARELVAQLEAEEAPAERVEDSAAAVVDGPLTCTLQEAADLIGVSRTTVDRLLEQGLIYERKVPGVRRRLISRRSVVAFIDG
jgi:excisionase family DNA binding protein